VSEPSFLSTPPKSDPPPAPVSPAPVFPTARAVERKPMASRPKPRATNIEPTPLIGDSAGEHLTMQHGRYSAWIHVVLAFALEAAVLGALPVIALRYVLHPLSPDGEIATLLGFGIGAVLAYLVFRDRWRCIEAFSSRFCSGLMNLSILYVPLVAFVYANTRGIAKLRR